MDDSHSDDVTDHPQQKKVAIVRRPGRRATPRVDLKAQATLKNMKTVGLNRARAARASTKAGLHNTLVTLPPELRNTIYECVLHPGEGRPDLWRPNLPSKAKRSFWRQQPGIVWVNKQTRHEAFPIYLKLNHIHLWITIGQLENFSNWLSLFKARHGNDHDEQLQCRGISLHFLHLSWLDVADMYKLACIVRQHLGTTAVSATAVGRHLSKVASDAIELGKQAYKQGWSSDRLILESMPLGRAAGRTVAMNKSSQYWK